MPSRSLRCPICKAETNRRGEPFLSEWAVACHVAGSVHTGMGQIHRSWVMHNVPDALSLLPGFNLAEALLGPITQAIEADQPSPDEPHKRIGF